MTRFTLGLLLIAFVAIGLSSPALAQTYARTETTVTYSERAGTGSESAVWTDDSRDDGARFVPLPWDFPYFDRTHKSCWMNTNGRIQFYDYEVDDYDFDDLTPTVTEDDVIDTISVIACDIMGPHDVLRDWYYSVHYESDRVVFQWREVGMYDSDDYNARLNFQCHLFQSGEIRMYMGSSSAFLNDYDDYVSGIVNDDGTAAFPGFGNTLLIQSTNSVPANGTCVTLIPSGFTQADGVVLGPRFGATYSDVVAYEGATDVVIGQFCLQANGAGGTVTDINIQSDISPSITETITMKLYADAGTLGVVDGSDVLLGTQPLDSDTTFSGLTETLDGTTPLRNYLLTADLTAIDEEFDSSFLINLENDSDITTSGAAVWGGYFDGDTDPDNPRVLFLEGPWVEYEVSTGDGEIETVLAGGAERVAASFEAVLRESNAASVILNSFETAVNLGGSVVIGDVAQVALYRDAGTVGVLDGADVAIGTVANPVSTTINFTGLAEVMNTDGQDYLITVMVGTSFTAMTPAQIGVTVSDVNEGFTPAAGFWTSCDDNVANQLQILPNAAILFLSPNEATRSNTNDVSLPVLQGTTGVPVVHFVLQASSGTQTVTVLDLTGDGTELSAATLYRDTGTVPGRVDGGDTMVGTATLTATNVTFAGLTESIGVAPVNYLVAMDVSATATTGSALLYNMTSGGVTSGVTTIGLTSTGSVTPVDATSDGFDITINFLTSNGDLSGSDEIAIATCQQVARGLGGTPASLEFVLLNAWGGFSQDGLEVAVYLEGAGPIGQLDSTDIPLGFGDDTLNPDATNTDWSADWGSATRNLLYTLRWQPREDLCDFDGRFEVVFRGLSNGSATNPAYASEPGYILIGGTVAVTAPSSSGGGGGGGSDDGGCSTSGNPGTNWLLLLTAVAGMALVIRQRRSRA